MLEQISVEKHTLSNGVTILLDRIEHRSTTTCALCLVGGLRDENAKSLGVSHFLEHLLFKRTQRKNTVQIAEVIDTLGGDVNAFTDFDSLCLHGTVPEGNFLSLLDFLCELVTETKLDEKDLGLEREVIKQEIVESNDDPSESVYHLFSRKFWPNSVLGQPVFGNLDTLKTISLSDLSRRREELLQGRRLVIAAAGNVDFDKFVSFVEARFSSLPVGDRPEFPRPQGNGNGIFSVPRGVSQCHFSLGFPWPGICDEDFYSGLVASSVLGEGMSSRLFQTLREEHGLAYEVDSDVEAYPDVGVLTVNAIVERDKFQLACELVIAEMQRLKKGGPTQHEFDKTVSMLRAGAEMSADSLSSRMWRAIETEIVWGRYIGLDEALRKLQLLSLEKVSGLIDKWFELDNGLFVVGGNTENLEFPNNLSEFCGVAE